VRLRSVMILLLSATVSIQVAAADVVDPEDVVRAMVEAVNRRDLDALDAIVAPDVRRHSAATPDVMVENLEQLKAFLRADFAAVPDSVQTVDMIFAGGDMVAVRGTYKGTQTGRMGPFPPSGRTLTLPYIGILRVRKGKIAEIWIEWDNLSALTQLGHFPPQPGKNTTTSGG